MKVALWIFLIGITDQSLTQSVTSNKKDTGHNEKSDKKKNYRPQIDQTKCHIVAGCFSDCDSPSSCAYTLRWGEAEAGLIKVELMGKPSHFALLETERMWLAFGFSKYGTMDYSNIFLCKKIEENYSAVRADGYAHGIRRKSVVEIKDGPVTGHFEDGLMFCSYYINTTNLPQKDLALFYGMGPIDNNSLAQQHRKTPRPTTHKFRMTTPLVDPPPIIETKSGSSSIRLTCWSLFVLLILEF